MELKGTKTEKIFGQHLQENLKHLQSITIMHLKQKRWICTNRRTF